MKNVKKTMRSTISFLLSITMMLAVFVIPVYADEPEPEDVTIHYYNENNWQSPYLYYYADNNNPVAWPGVAMTSDGDNWYSYTVSNFDEIRIIFSNNGSNQYPAQNEPGILISGEKWFKNGNLYSQDPDTFNITVHYYNGNGWSSPYIYYYDTNNSPVSWPGTAMTSDGNGWYSYVINGFDSARVIFSDNGSNQTPAQNEPGYLVSGEKWFVGSTAYDSEPDGITVHFFNYNNWSNVNIYYYIGELTGSQWTGVPMNPEGDGWYSYKLFGFDEARVIFNNGNGTQIPAPIQEGFYVDEDSWYRNGTWTDSRPEDIVVYFCKPTGWSTPNIYFYLNNNDTGPSWPGTAMTEISDGWYAATIAKYSSAKVMFNDGTNQIPSQNQPGLDAEGIMWYKNGIWCDSETDTDEDELLDYMELLLGTNINNTDSDSDGLPDGFEALALGTDPSLADTDDNNVSDAYEDADSDSLTNLAEYQLGTDPTITDSDSDGLSDGAEVNTYLTEPTDEDTDGDGASDGWEVEHGFNPLEINSSFEVTLSLGFRDDDVAPSVSIELDGDQADSLQIEQITDNRYFLEETVGIIGAPYEFDVSGTFDSAEISFEFDSDLLLDEDFDPVICWFDEENQKIEFLETTITGNVASAEVEHFSVYMLVYGSEFSHAFSWGAKYTVSDLCDKVELAVLIDDSVNMQTKDPDDLRIDIANEFCTSLPGNATVSVFKLNSIITTLAYLDGTIYSAPASFSYDLINRLEFESSGQESNLYSILNSAPSCFTEDDPQSTQQISRVILLITDGQNLDSVNRTEALAAVADAGAVINVIGIGNEFDIPDELRTLAYAGGGRYLNWSKYEDMVNAPEDYICFEADYDLDGLPDDFEGNITIFNGNTVYSDPIVRDTDGDGLTDGEEIELKRTYRNNRTEVSVYAFLNSDPSNEDGDMDGMIDSIDPMPLNQCNKGHRLFYSSDSDRLITLLQKCLEHLGYLNMTEDDGTVTPYGKMGGRTAAALKLFQLNYGLNPVYYDHDDYINKENAPRVRLDDVSFLIALNVAINNGFEQNNGDALNHTKAELYNNYASVFIHDYYDFLCRSYHSTLSNHTLPLNELQSQAGVTVDLVNGIYYYDYTVPINNLLRYNQPLCESMSYDLFRFNWFKDMVDHGKIWDIKRPYRWYEHFGYADMKYYAADFKFKYYSMIIDSESLGNITYGYWGAATGIDVNVLILGGGFAASTSDLSIMISNALIASTLSSLSYPYNVYSFIILFTTETYYSDSSQDRKDIALGYGLYYTLN